jgi:hypothetical protein
MNWCISYHILARKSRAAHSTPPPHNFLEQGKTQVCGIVDLDPVGSEKFDRIRQVPDPDPLVFGPPRSGSISQRYGSGSGSCSGSGSFYH